MYKFNINTITKVYSDTNNINSRYFEFIKSILLVDKEGNLITTISEKGYYYIYIPNIFDRDRGAENWTDIDITDIDFRNTQLEYELGDEFNSKMSIDEVDKILDDHASYIFNCYRDNKEGYKLLNEDNLIYLDLSDVMQRLYFTNLGMAMNMIKPLVKDIMNRIEGAVIA